MAVAPGVANPYAAGAKVYNGGSSAATSGPVDPTGYIDRELNNNQSYTPGVAAGALGVLKSNLSTDVQKNDTAWQSCSNAYRLLLRDYQLQHP